MIEKKLNEVVWFQEGPGVRNTQYTTNGVKLLNVANLVDGNIVLSNSSRYISEEEAFGKYKHFLCDEGDLIIASSGIKVEYLDKKMGLVTKDMLPLCMNTSTIRFKVKDKNELNLKYLMYYLKSEKYKTQIQKLITGSAQLNYGPSHLNKVHITMHPLNKQEEIVKKLDQVTSILVKKQQKLEKYDLLVKSQFIEMFGDPIENTKHWESVPLGDLCEITRGGSPRPIEKYLGGNIPW
ncbi:MAG: restriction endonuclease subunit S, partial [Clostridia bacterium]|nr:restriction endonuclease subunit S [Clostridia bacterium]